MYRSYTQVFRIFGAVIIFLQISKVTALFKIQKILNLTVLSLLSLTARSRCQRHRTEHTAALSTPVDQNASAVRFRRGGLHQHDLHYPANLPRPLEQQQAHRRKLHAGHGGHGGADTAAHDTTPATTR